MKKIILIYLLFQTSLVYSQIADTIEVGFTKSAYLIFDDSTLLYDVGSEDVLIRVNNEKMILQAQVENFEETNLLVDANGVLRVFIVKYVETPSRYLYRYQKEELNLSVPIAILDKKEPVSRDSVVEALINQEHRVLNRGVVKYKLGIYLRDYIICDGVYYLKFEAVNKSNIPYTVDFFSMNVVNVKRRIKGESKQMVQINQQPGTKIPVDFKGKERISFVVVVDPFVLTEDKKLRIEFWEKNGKDLDFEGGRKVSFDLFSRDLLNIKKVI